MSSTYCGWWPSCHRGVKCLDCNRSEEYQIYLGREAINPNARPIGTFENPSEEYQIYLGREAINPNARPLGTFENPSEEYQIYLGREAVNPNAHPLGTFETKTSVRCSKRTI